MATSLPVINLVSGDDLPVIQFQLSDENGNPIDLSVATTEVYAKFRKRGTTTVLFTQECTKIAGGYAGICELEWPTDALDVAAGYYELEFYLSYDGKIQTVWDVQKIRVRADF